MGSLPVCSDGVDFEVHDASLLRVGDLVCVDGSWTQIDEPTLSSLTNEGPKVLRWTGTLLSSQQIRDQFETEVGPHVFRIHRGHPMYCMVDGPHEPHLHRYAYLRYGTDPTLGYVYCDGLPINFQPKENQDV